MLLSLQISFFCVLLPLTILYHLLTRRTGSGLAAFLVSIPNHMFYSFCTSMSKGLCRLWVRCFCMSPVTTKSSMEVLYVLEVLVYYCGCSFIHDHAFMCFVVIVLFSHINCAWPTCFILYFYATALHCRFTLWCIRNKPNLWVKCSNFYLLSGISCIDVMNQYGLQDNRVFSC